SLIGLSFEQLRRLAQWSITPQRLSAAWLLHAGPESPDNLRHPGELRRSRRVSFRQLYGYHPQPTDPDQDCWGCWWCCRTTASGPERRLWAAEERHQDRTGGCGARWRSSWRSG